jgi:hypothetical protein
MSGSHSHIPDPKFLEPQLHILVNMLINDRVFEGKLFRVSIFSLFDNEKLSLSIVFVSLFFADFCVFSPSAFVHERKKTFLRCFSTAELDQSVHIHFSSEILH